ncbi:MAG: lysophospholipid acyltransferase family protein [Pseudomonadota bacterium]
MRRHILDHPVSYYAIFLASRYLPLSICRWLGKVVALIIYVFSNEDRKSLCVNLSMALGRPAGDPVVRKTVRRLFANYGRYMVDFFLLPQLPPHKVKKFFADIKGEEILKSALTKGRGAILLSAHVGNWEIGGSMLRLLNYPLAVVVMTHNTAATNALVNRLRQDKGIRVIAADQSPFAVVEVLRHLRNNGIVAMNGDRDYFGTGRQVNFMGKKVNLPVGPVIMAMKSGAALIPAFVLQQPDGRYFGVLEEAIALVSEGDRDEAVEKNLEITARIFEKYIRSYPDQWYCPDPLPGTLGSRKT